MATKSSYTFNLTGEQSQKLVSILSAGNYLPVEVPYTVIAVKAPSWNCTVNVYTSGKCLVQGRGAEDFVANVMEPEVLGCFTVGYEDIASPEQWEPHMGVDESGKGDFFGPLVIAAAYTDRNTAKLLKDIGVRDSKAISSDAQALKIAARIRGILGPLRYSVVCIGNPAYNRLYAKIRSVNRLLSWGHARCIENVLSTIPSCPKAVSDQFGDKETLQRALMSRGKAVELVQRHRAESDIAVAAASILAREGFLASLSKLQSEFGVPFPKGASAAVVNAARELVSARGPEVMISTAKCHFKTLDKVLESLGLSRENMSEYGRVASQDSSAREFHKETVH